MLVSMINAMEVREDDEDFKNPVDLMFEALEEREPEHFAVRQYKKYKLAAGVVCSKRLLNQAVGKSLRTHNLKPKKGAQVMRKNEKITALYERLSRDDFGKDDDQQRESNSISNQKAMLEEFAARQGFTNIVHFTDDGISGTCFDRPGFLAMMKEVEAGNVEYLCIKDMSRMGRDYLKVGQIMEILRQRGVRLIAINDGVDSARGDDDFTPFRNIMNEYYARDTSRKIRSTFQSKGKSGKHLTGTVIYGYLWNEAMIYKDEQCIAKNPMPRALAEEIANDLWTRSDGQGEVMLSGQNTAYLMERGLGMLKRIQFIGNNYQIIHDPSEVPEEITKVSVYLHEGVESYTERFVPRWKEANCAVAGPYWIDTTFANKGIGVRSICKTLDIDPADVMAFGDNYNDVSMLDIVGVPYIMDGAAAPLREKYPNHTPRPEDVLREFLKQN